MYILLHCHHQNESCINSGSDESHFTVLLFVRDKITTLFKGMESRSGIEPRPFCLTLSFCLMSSDAKEHIRDNL